MALGEPAPGDEALSGVGLLMNLRKAANHPLLIRDHYDDETVRTLARTLKTKDSGHRDAVRYGPLNEVGDGRAASIPRMEQS